MLYITSVSIYFIDRDERSTQGEDETKRKNSKETSNSSSRGDHGWT